MNNTREDCSNTEKRKRLDDSDPLIEEDLVRTCDSEKTPKPPRKSQKRQNNHEESDDMKPGDSDDVREMLKTLLQETADIKSKVNHIPQLQEECEELRKSFEMLRKSCESNENKWKEEKLHMKSHILSLEDKIEKMEKREKRNNMVIIGLDTKKEARVQETVEGFFNSSFGVNPGFNSAYTIGKTKKGETITLVKFNNGEEKDNIMRRRSTLNGSRIFVNNDLTEREREIQFRIRNLANEYRREGKDCKIYHQKLKVDGQMFEWNHGDGNLTPKNDYHEERRK